MRDKEKDAIQMAIKRKDFLEKSYELFTKRNIESVSMLEIARVCGYGTTTLYRYFKAKPNLVVSVATWRWKQVLEENAKKRSDDEIKDLSGAQLFEYYLDALLDMYRNDKDLLRFNQFFNIYIQAEKIDDKVLEPYQDIIEEIENRFHLIFEKAQSDHTLKTDVSEKEMFSTTLHLMLAAITRYAVGLAYKPKDGFDAEKELLLLKDMLLKEYKA
ncbi:MAG: TetR/AcrR family transcriptional regulator [Lachnospiraceae bacterium]|nr:TetR/AcrR family transcriptional regulator [Lachnospiraceae bacterium]